MVTRPSPPSVRTSAFPASIARAVTCSASAQLGQSSFSPGLRPRLRSSALPSPPPAQHPPPPPPLNTTRHLFSQAQVFIRFDSCK